ncbi:hypothetical protein ACVWZM_001302 [Bradyrhizobium sp. USDA 4501]
MPEFPRTPLRLRGEVGSHRRCDPGEGVQVYPRPILADAAPHPDPLPARAGRGRSGTASYASIPRCIKIRSALSFQTSILTICPPRTTKRST